jgi:uncharacterized protein YprB with RNaseH-like and TPR domain
VTEPVRPADMLTHTFLHLKGVGRELERRLWDAGAVSWEGLGTFRGRIPGVGEKKRASILEGVEVSAERLAAGDARFFHDRLSASERWRMAGDFRDRLAFVDIETTGIGRRARTTVVGAYAGGEARLFVKGVDLGEFRTFLEARDVWVSYNGLTFDEPFLRREFGESVRPAAHIDLRYCLRAVGLAGGLKAVERSIGIHRPAELAELDGWDAVRLWQEYLTEGRPGSLKTLVEYNMEDVVNMEPLLALAAARHVRERGLPMEPFVIESTPASRDGARREAVAEVGRLTGCW